MDQVHEKSLRQQWKELIRSKEYLKAVAASVLLLIVSFVASFLSALYATVHMGSPVPDLVLNILPTFKVYGLYVYGPVLFVLVCAVICIRNPRSLPFVIKAAALFTVTRAFFVMLTHLGLPEDMFTTPSVLAPEVFKTFFLRGDLFFSGHTGFPFLFALIFWAHPHARGFFMASSIVLGLTVLLGHYHYTIDVVAAYFITYTIFCIAKQAFARDYLFFKGQPYGHVKKAV